MHQLVASDELANDVTGAEAPLERHQDYGREIDARSAAFLSFQQFGNSGHYAADDVRQRRMGSNFLSRFKSTTG